jgi:hypothetical protein
MKNFIGQNLIIEIKDYLSFIIDNSTQGQVSFLINLKHPITEASYSIFQRKPFY